MAQDPGPGGRLDGSSAVVCRLLRGTSGSGYAASRHSPKPTAKPLDYQRACIFELNLPYRRRLRVERSVYTGGAGPRLAVAAGVHGDELEGLAVCHRLGRWIEDAERSQPGTLRGCLELYPALNPLAIDAQSRQVPLYDADLNRSFPGHTGGHLPQRLAAAVHNALRGCDLVVALHASNPYLREHPQVRLHPHHAVALRPLAEATGLEVIWARAAPPVGEGSLAYSCNGAGTPSLTLVAGSGMRCGGETTAALVQAVLRLAGRLGVVAASAVPTAQEPAAPLGDRVGVLDAPSAGLFLANVAPGPIADDALIGTVVSPYSGEVLAEVRAPGPGFLFSLREYPLVYQGSLVARIALQGSP